MTNLEGSSRESNGKTTPEANPKIDARFLDQLLVLRLCSFGDHDKSDGIGASTFGDCEWASELLRSLRGNGWRTSEILDGPVSRTMRRLDSARDGSGNTQASIKSSYQQRRRVSICLHRLAMIARSDRQLVPAKRSARH